MLSGGATCEELKRVDAMYHLEKPKFVLLA